MKRILIFFFIFCIVSISVSNALQEKAESQAEHHRRQGDAYMKKNRNFLAIEEYRTAI